MRPNVNGTTNYWAQRRLREIVIPCPVHNLMNAGELSTYLGKVVVEVGGQPRQQDEEAVVLAKVADDAGPQRAVTQVRQPGHFLLGSRSRRPEEG